MLRRCHRHVGDRQQMAETSERLDRDHGTGSARGMRPELKRDGRSELEADAPTDTAPTGAFASAGPLGPPFARATAALASQQFATDSAQATAVSRIGDTAIDASLAGSRFTVDGNSSVAESAGNRASNSLVVGTMGSAGPGAALANSQTSIAQVTATATTRAGYALTAPTVSPIAGSTIAIENNTTSALARGNAADNAMTVAGTGDAATPGSIDLRNEAVQGGVVLLNGQANYGAVTASAADSSYLVPLNASAAVSGSTVTIGGNAIGASAYGNMAIVPSTASHYPRRERLLRPPLPTSRPTMVGSPPWCPAMATCPAPARWRAACCASPATVSRRRRWAIRRAA